MAERRKKISDATSQLLRSDPKSRILRSVNPLGLRVLVRIQENAEVTDGGLYIPESAKKTLTPSVLAEVLEVASALDHDSEEETNISGIPQGATVLISKHCGVPVPWDEAIRIVDTKDILAIVEEVKLS